MKPGLVLDFIPTVSSVGAANHSTVGLVECSITATPPSTISMTGYGTNGKLSAWAFHSEGDYGIAKGL